MLEALVFGLTCRLRESIISIACYLPLALSIATTLLLNSSYLITSIHGYGVGFPASVSAILRVSWAAPTAEILPYSTRLTKHYSSADRYDFGLSSTSISRSSHTWCAAEHSGNIHAIIFAPSGPTERSYCRTSCGRELSPWKCLSSMSDLAWRDETRRSEPYLRR